MYGGFRFSEMWSCGVLCWNKRSLLSFSSQLSIAGVVFTAQSSSRPRPRSKRTELSQIHRPCQARCLWQTDWRDVKILTKWSLSATQRCLDRSLTAHSSAVSQSFNAHSCCLNQWPECTKSPHLCSFFKNWIRSLPMPQRILEEQRFSYQTHVNWKPPRSQVWLHHHYVRIKM